MKALVTYCSRTGNTEKLARAIYDALPCEKELIPIADVKDASGYGIIFVGFPVEAHSVPTEALPLFKILPAGQPIALFCTHGALRGGPLPKQALEHAASLASRVKVLGTFGVRGQVSPRIIEILQRSAEHQAWAEEAQSACGHPDTADLTDARAFALEMVAKIGH
ncbi:MAG: hypothetical protein M0009_05190 [Deltaproteobacteria bacterium]|nr:hypothetical protein [Deltaproteobacteria bacterium]